MRSKKLTGLIVLCVLLIVYIIFSQVRPIGQLKLSGKNKPVLLSSAPKQINLPPTYSWPSVGQSALGVEGTNYIDSSATNSALPTASTAKMITCLTILKYKPLSLGEQGPTITLSQSDVNIYNAYVAQDGSVTQVVNGEQISEYQMLQTILLPSADNMADSLAIWAFGSLTNYQLAATKYLTLIGANGTKVGSDASGLSPTTVSTPANLVLIANKLMSSPVLAQIVGMQSATNIPVVGTIKNVNSLLGQYGIIGVKTGSSDQAGGVYVSASTIKVGLTNVTLLTALDNGPNLATAMASSLTLIKPAQTNYYHQQLLDNQNVYSIYIPWQNKTVYGYVQDFTPYAWGGSKENVNYSLENLDYPITKDSVIGQVSVSTVGLSNQTANILITQSVPKPGIFWRLTHPIGG